MIVGTSEEIDETHILEWLECSGWVQWESPLWISWIRGVLNRHQC